ncbi:MAG: galactose-1-phosphate uridylyltransferase [Acidobacteriota bacterium]
MSELRWHPLLEQWVVTATHRQERTYKPPDGYCPLCPTKDGLVTEVPAADYEIVVFENKFPSFTLPAPASDITGNDLHPVAPAAGLCEVILYSPDHNGSLATESIPQIHRLVRVWRDRFESLGGRPEIAYVFIFENKGDVIGVTLAHPHGQIYAFPFIPPQIEKELNACRNHEEKTGHCLICDIVVDERRDGRRVVCENDSFTAVVPFYARYPYEVHILARRHLQALPDLTEGEELHLAEILKDVLVRYDSLFGFSFPYMMVMHQRPTDDGDYDYYHFHIEFYPPHRTATKIKYLAGCESGAGTFVNDTLAEEKAAELRAAGVFN